MCEAVWEGIFCKNYICHKIPTLLFQILSPYIELPGIWGITNTPTWLADYTYLHNNNNRKSVIAKFQLKVLDNNTNTNT